MNANVAVYQLLACERKKEHKVKLYTMLTTINELNALYDIYLSVIQSPIF